MVRTKKKVAVLGRGGDKVVAGNMFYASEAARPALKVLDSMQNIEAPVAASKSKDKRPVKPKTAAQLYAENECETIMIQSGFHENQSKLAIKTCKDDALAAFNKGDVDQAIVDKYTEKEQAERAKHEKAVEQWNEAHPDETLAIGKHGTAVRSQANPEKLKKKEHKAAVTEAKKKASRPGTTKDLQGVSDRAALKLKKIQAKNKKLKAKGKKKDEYIEEGDNEVEDNGDEDGGSEDVGDDESEPELSEDEEEEKEEQPVKSKAQKVDQAAKEKKESPSCKRKAEAVADTEGQAGGPKAKKNSTKAAAAKKKQPKAEAEPEEEVEPAPKVPKSKAVAKKAAAQKPDSKKGAVAQPAAGKQTTASKRTHGEVDTPEETARAQPSKKKPAKSKEAGAKTADGAEAEGPRKSRLSRIRKPQNSKKHLGPTMPKQSPTESNSAYTGEYDVPSDDECGEHCTRERPCGKVMGGCCVASVHCKIPSECLQMSQQSTPYCST